MNSQLSKSRAVTAWLMVIMLLSGFGAGVAFAAGESEAESETTTLVFNSWWAYVGDAEIDYFEAENPNINVEWEYVPPGDTYFNRIRVMSQSGSLPDLFGVQADVFTELVREGFLRDLADDLQTPAYKQDATWGDTFDPVLLESADSSLAEDVQDPNRKYGVPFGAISIAVIYNKTIFEEVGIGEPADWDEFMSNNDALSEAGYVPLSFVGEGWGNWYYRMLMDQTLRGVTPEDWLNGDIAFTDDRVGQTFEIVKDMWDRGHFSPSALTNGIEDAQNLFVRGRLAQFLVVPENFVGYLVENSPESVNLGAFVFPAALGVEPSRTLGGSANVLVVNDDTEDEDAAVTFAKFMTSQEIFQLLSTKYVVPSLRGYEPPEGDLIMGAYAQAVNNGFIPPILPSLGASFTSLIREDLYPRILTDQITIDEAQQQLQEALEKYLTENPRN